VVASTANKISSNGKHIVGWTAVDGYFGSFKLTLDQLCVCRNDKSMQVGYPGGVASQLEKGASEQHLSKAPPLSRRYIL